MRKTLLFGFGPILAVLVSLAVSGCNVENYEKIRRNPNLSFRYEKAVEYYEKGAYEKAQYLFEDLIPLFQGRDKAQDVYYYYANTHYKLNNYTFAAYYFKRFHETYPNSDKAEEALYLSAECSYKLSPVFRLTQEDTDKAIDGFQRFVNTYPTSPLVPACNEKIDILRRKLETKAFESAIGYYHREDYQAAMSSFKTLLIEYPESPNTEELRFRLMQAQYKFAQASILSKQAERFSEVMSYFNIFKRKYPESEYMNDADFMNTSALQKVKNLSNE